MRSFAAVLLSLALALSLAAAELPPEVDAYVREQMAKRHLPGVVVAISRDGVIAEKAYGLANVELDVPLSTKHLFPIASATKPFTSALILSLVRDGKLQLDDAVGELLPDMPESWREVTVRQLLSHTSGLPDVTVKPGSAELIATTRDEALAKLRTMPLQFARGEKWSYNQTNYALLQMIAEKITGQPVETAMAGRVFDPAGMTAATYGDTDALVRGRVSLYVFENDRLAPRRLLFPGFLHTAAGINASARDLIAFLAASEKLIAAPLRAQAWTPVQAGDDAPGYGLGWAVQGEGGQLAVGHSGGGVAAMTWYPQSRTALVVLTNGRTNPDSLLAGIAAIVMDAGRASAHP